MSLLSVFRGLLPHSDVPPFIALPFPEGTNTAALGNRLNPYRVTIPDGIYRSPEDGPYRSGLIGPVAKSTVIDLTARRMLETGWPPSA